ncbi:outer membrane beta-barrel protein [Flavobacterium sp.]|uniref:outer membrane beta-barrel protein n=1 Tax=Flavobacterium sp. TaxID=239 RepID=UPI003340C526
MKYKILIFILLLLFSSKIISQTNEIINPKGKWFFGAEIGLNAITSVHPSRMTSLQAGFLAEYYFAKNWSINGRIKYFETGVVNKNDSSKGVFEGAVIAVPLNIIWKYRIVKNFSGNLKLGITLNQEIKSNYYYPPNEKTDYSKFYGSFNPGIGFNYFISKNTAVYISYEVYVFGNDRDEADWLQIVPNSPNNNLFNIGIKHNFKIESENK